MRADLIRPLPEILRTQAAHHADKVAYQDHRRDLGYADLDRGTARLAGHLAALGLGRGERALICLGNGVEVVESYLAVARAAGVAVPVNPQAADAELGYLLDDSAAAAVITDRTRLPALRRVLRERGGDGPAVIVVDDAGPPPVPGTPPPGGPAAAGTHDFARLLGTEPPRPPRDDLGLDEVAWSLYTSGTTGRPKGVLATQRNALWSVAAGYAGTLGLNADDHLLWPMPMFHSLAHVLCVLGVPTVGASARVLPGYAAGEVLRAVRAERCTVLVGVPTMYRQLLRAAEDGGLDARGLRACLVTGAVAPPELRRSFEAAFGVPLIDTYGATETSGAITMADPAGGAPDGSCGLPLAGLSTRLVDPRTGRDAPPGDEGEVWVSGPNVMLGYHGRPEVTAEVLRDGWYRTGDLARRDLHGFLTITGRLKELIIRGGENIHPGEVEEALRGAPGVAEAAVAGLPHDLLGEIPAAFVVPDPAAPLDPARLLGRCRERLAPYKVPDEVYAVEAIPRTGSGKVKRRALTERPARLVGVNGARYGALLRPVWEPLAAGTAADGPGPQHPDAAPDTAPGPAREAAEGAPGTADPGGPGGPEYGTDPAAGAAVVPLRDAAPTVAGGRADTDAATRGLTLLRRTLELARHWRDDPADDPSGTGGAAAGDPDGAAGRTPGGGAGGSAGGSRLVLVTDRAVALPGDPGPPDPAQAAAYGAARALQRAHPGRIVLLDADEPDIPMRLLATALASGEPHLAVRAGRLYTARLERVPVPPAAPAEGAAGTGEAGAGTGAPGAESGTAGAGAARTGGLAGRAVLVTGGPRERLVRVARHLVHAHGARQVTVAAAPEEAAGDPATTPAAAPAADSAADSARSDSAAGLAADGGDAAIRCVPCDLTDHAAARELFDGPGGSAPVAAIVHVAGPPGPAAGPEAGTGAAGTDALERDWRAATVPLLNLLRLAERAEGLAAFVLLTDAAMALRPPEPAPAAARALADALLRRLHAAGRPVVSLAWGPPEPGEESAAPCPGAAPMTERQALAMFDAAYATGGPSLVAARPDETLRRGELESVPAALRGLLRHEDAEQAAAPDGEAAAAAGAELRRRLGELRPGDRRRLLLDLVRADTAAVGGMTGPEAVRPDMDFKSLGFDSATAVRFRNRIVASTGLTLKVTLAFDHPTPARLAEELLSRLAEPPETAAAEKAADDVASKIETATDDEIFAFIDNELSAS